MLSHLPSANTAAVITIAAPTDVTKRHVLDQVHWSYSVAPTGGRLTITSGTQPPYDVDIPGAGPGAVSFPRGFRGALGASVVVTLAAPGGVVVGKVIVPTNWIE